MADAGTFGHFYRLPSQQHIPPTKSVTLSREEADKDRKKSRECPTEIQKYRFGTILLH